MYGGAEKLTKVKLQTLRRQHEVLNMEKESDANYFTKVITLTNNIKNCGEPSTDQTIVKNVLRSLNPRFYHIVGFIEERKNLESMKVDGL